MCCFEKSSRGTLWTAWSIVNFIGLGFSAAAFFTFGKVYHVYKQSGKSDHAEIFTMLTALAFCAVLVLVFMLMSLFLLISKSMARTKAGFMYGFLTSSSANLSLVLLLCSLALMGFKNDVKNKFEGNSEEWDNMTWGGGDTTLYTVVFALGLVSAFMYMAFFVMMLIFSSSVDDPSTTERLRAEEEGLID